MARHSRLAVLNAMVETGLVPVFYHPDLEVAKKIIAACAAGGVKVIEFTNRGDFAYSVFNELSRHVSVAHPDIMLGIGSVMDAPTAAMYIASGADFVVSPVLNAEVARLCNRRKIPFSPGCGTLSEISQAEELGVEIVKLFPGSSVGGPGFVRDVSGPCPWTRLMPTGGVDASEESVKAWFQAGVVCVGMGSKLFRKDLMAAGDYPAISATVAQVLKWIQQYKIH